MLAMDIAESESPSFCYKLGVLPLADNAPLIIAKLGGFFDRHEVGVELSCEIGWSTLREKLVSRELDGACAVAGHVASIRLGLHAAPCPVIAPLVMSLQGGAITLSQTLHYAGVRDAVSLCALVRSHQNRVLTFGIISRWSPHYFLLRDWLASGGLKLDEDVRLVTLPAPVMPKLLTSGAIDGFCGAEPWNSASVLDGTGWMAAATGSLSPLHVEKVLILHEPTARAHPDVTRRLIAALKEACAWCEEAGNHSEVVEMLQACGYFNTNRQALRACWVGPFDAGNGRQQPIGEFQYFHHQDANTPTSERALWLLRGLRRHGVVTSSQEAELKETLVASWGVMSQPAKPAAVATEKTATKKKQLEIV